MATTTRPRHCNAPQPAIGLHRHAASATVTARLGLSQARELVGRLSLVDPRNAGAAAAHHDR